MANPSFTGSYSVTTQYLPGDYVTYGGKLYQAKLSNNAISPTNNTVWTLVSSTFAFIGVWSTNTTYSIGQTVIDGSNYGYISLANTNLGNQPNTSPTQWRVFNNNYINVVSNQPGDMQYEGATTPVRLPIGSLNQVLTVSNTGLPVWANTQNPIGNTTNLFVNSVTTNNLLTSNTVTSNTYFYPNGESPGYTYTLDDISSQFDGMATSFILTYNGTPIAPNNPNQVQLQIGNISVYPNSKSFDYFNLTTEIYTQQNGFTVSGNTITFATAPLQGMGFYGTYKTSADQMPPFYFYQVPFAPLNIMLS
jgi:hypothetical protein